MTHGHRRHLYREPNKFVLDKERPMIDAATRQFRLNGTAVITADPEVLDGFTNELKVPNAAILVTVVTTFIHCEKALQRSNIWKPAAWSAFAGGH